MYNLYPNDDGSIPSRESFTVNLAKVTELIHGDDDNFAVIESSLYSKEDKYNVERYIVRNRTTLKYFHFFYNRYKKEHFPDENEKFILSEVFPREIFTTIYV